LRTDERQQNDVARGVDYVSGDLLETMSAYSPAFNSAVNKRLRGHPVVRSPRELRLHRALDELRLTATGEEFNEAARRGTRSLQEPVLIAACGTILAGIGQWRLALFEGTQEIHCIEYLLNEDECLEFILRFHQPRRVWNAFVRTSLALTLEPVLQQRALENMRGGGKYKGWANLPDLHRIDVRQEISKLAGVGARTVSNVKAIVKSAHPRLIEALNGGTLTVNGAIQLCKFPRSEQAEQFSRSREERAIKKVIRQAIAQPNRETRPDTASLLEALMQQEAQQPGSVDVRIGNLRRTVLVLGQDQSSGPRSQRELKLV